MAKLIVEKAINPESYGYKHKVTWKQGTKVYKHPNEPKEWELHIHDDGSFNHWTGEKSQLDHGSSEILKKHLDSVKKLVHK
jgi:hypothetical protein